MVENFIPPTSPSETGEGNEGSQDQSLVAATVEPGALVEQTGNFRQSEAIQSALTTVVNNIAAVDPIPLPDEAQVTNQAQVAGTNAGGVVSPGDEVSVVPNPLPRVHEGSGDSQVAPDERSGDNVEVVPTPLPYEAQVTNRAQVAEANAGGNASLGDEVSVMPNPLPRVQEGSGITQSRPDGTSGDTVEVLPTPLPYEAQVTNQAQVAEANAGGNVFLGNEVSVVPNPLPRVQEGSGITQGRLDGTSGDTVEVLPNPLPHLAEGNVSGDTVEVLPDPLPHAAEGMAVQEVGSSIGEIKEIGGLTPIQIPMPAPDDLGGDVAADLHGPPPNEAIGTGEQEVGSNIGEVKEIGGLTPIQMPMPAPDDSGGDIAVDLHGPPPNEAMGMGVQEVGSSIGEIKEIGGLTPIQIPMPGPDDSGGDIAADLHGPPPNEAMGMGVQEVGSSIGEIKEIGGLTPIQIPMPGPDTPGVRAGDPIPLPGIHINPGAIQGMMTSVMGEPHTDLEMEDKRIAAHKGMEQVSHLYANVDLSAFTSRVEVLAARSTGDVLPSVEGPLFKNSNRLRGGEEGLKSPGANVEGPQLNDSNRPGEGEKGLNSSGANVEEPQLKDSNKPRDGEEGLKSPGAYVEITQGGLVLVDANGNPLSKQLQINQHKDANGNIYYTVWVPDALGGAEVKVPLYTRSDPIGYIKGTPEGYILVDANGTQIGGPAKVTTYTDADGNKHFLLTLPDGKQVEVTKYSPTLPNTYAHLGPNGDVILVDENGNRLPDQTKVTQYTDNNGVIHYEVWIPGGTPAEVPSYIPTLTDHYIKITSHGVILVDGNGMILPGNDQTKIVVHTDVNGNIYYTIWVPDALGGAEVKASIYSGSEQIGYVKETPQGLTLVDANGTQIGNPATVSSYTDAQGNKHYLVSLPGENGTVQVEVPRYSPTLPNTYAHVNPDGQVVLVDATGKPLPDQTKVTQYTDQNGVVHYEVWIPGGTPAEVPSYIPTTSDYYILVRETGVYLVDGTGTELPSSDQGQIVMHKNPDGSIYYTVWVPDALGGSEIKVLLFSGSEQIGYVKETPQGIITLVDANGSSTSGSQWPITSYIDAQGNKHYLVSLPGENGTVQVEVPRYSPTLPNTYAHVNPDGQIVLVDLNGKPLPDQTKVTQYTDNNGVIHYEVWIPGGTPAEVPPYTPSLSDWLNKPR